MELRDNMGSLGFPSPPTGPVSPPPSPPDNENTSLAVPQAATLNGFFLDAYPEAARALWTCRKGAARLLDMSVQFLGFPASVAGEHEPIFAYAKEGLEPPMQGQSTPRTTGRLASEEATSPPQIHSNAGPASYWTQARAVIRDITTSSPLQLETKWTGAALDSVQPPAEGPPPGSPPGLRLRRPKVSFWGSGILKIVIPVENHPQKRSFWLSDYHPLWMGGVN